MIRTEDNFSIITIYELYNLMKQAQAEALDPQLYPVGAAVKTLDTALAALEASDYVDADD